jgi:FlaA1/EpsC-like NDP-sugar epimerase/lipopolysaccharide/colanic/teichoic acid biosynthesis glycosyltransferase
MIQRTIDILLSLIGIILMLPFFPIILILIKLDSKGPVFYLCDRIGKDMKPFKMYKFRTMVDTPIQAGGSVCPQCDPRVTPFGRFLRRTKINEVPQFINILKGDMTFVGPRPEAPDLAALYPENVKRIFSIKPGLVGPNQILGRNEEELYPPGVDEKKFYIEKILPPKLKIDLEYIDNPNIFKNFRYIFLGVLKTLTGLLSKKHIQQNKSQLYLLSIDLILAIFSYSLTFCLITGRTSVMTAVMFLPFLISVRLCCAFYFGLYNRIIKYISYSDVLNTLKAVASGTIMITTLAVVMKWPVYTRAMALLDSFLLFMLLSGLRFGVRFWWEKYNKETSPLKPINAIIYGAGKAGLFAHNALASAWAGTYQVIGFIDDAPEKYGKTLNGLKILGNRHHLDALIKLYSINELIIAIPNASGDNLASIIDLCRKIGIKYRVFNCLVNVESECHLSYPVRDLTLADILPLKRIVMDRSAVQPFISGKTILVNGSGGALGLELCREIMHMGCTKLIVMDRFEAYLTELLVSLNNEFVNDRIVPVLNDGDWYEKIKQTFLIHRPEIVFHAGMRKYAPIIEINRNSIFKDNFEYTFKIAKLAEKYRCENFVLISSDAVKNNQGFIFDSLRIAELQLHKFFINKPTRFIVTRICDILENRGCMVSLIENQIKRKETISLPRDKVSIHLLSKRSAAHFILQTLAEASRPEFPESIFTCNAEPAIDLKEIATKTASLYGLRLGIDVPVRYSRRMSKRMQSSFSDREHEKLISTNHEAIMMLQKDYELNPTKHLRVNHQFPVIKFSASQT